MKAVDRDGFLDVLNQTADDLLADLELESVLHSILAQVIDLFGVDRCDGTSRKAPMESSSQWDRESPDG